jgi:hypothetical protein
MEAAVDGKAFYGPSGCTKCSKRLEKRYEGHLGNLLLSFLAMPHFPRD